MGVEEGKKVNTVKEVKEEKRVESNDVHGFNHINFFNSLVRFP